jgi:protein-disulfide isomerase
MASRKEQKEQARQARLAAEQAASERARQQRRLAQLVGVVVAVAAVVVVAIVVSTSGSSQKETGLQHGKQATATYAAVNRLLSGIPQTGTTLGSPSAPVTLTYFGDLECPVCQAFTLGEDSGGFPELVANDVRTGKVKVDYRSFCTATCGAQSDGAEPSNMFTTQQVAAYAAGQQNLFWDYAELFYREQGSEDSGYVTSDFLNKLAEQIPGLDLSKWTSDRSNKALSTQVANDESAASNDQVQGTPTLIASGPKGEDPIGSGILPYSTLEAAIKQVS